MRADTRACNFSLESILIDWNFSQFKLKKEEEEEEEEEEEKKSCIILKIVFNIVNGSFHHMMSFQLG